MILLNRFRIRALDKYNITFEELREIESKDKKHKRLEWSRVGGYYGTLDHTLKALKEYITQEYLSSDVSEDMMKVLDDLKESYVDTFISYEQEDTQKIYDILSKYRATGQLQITVPNEDDAKKIDAWLTKSK